MRKRRGASAQVLRWSNELDSALPSFFKGMKINIFVYLKKGGWELLISKNRQPFFFY